MADSIERINELLEQAKRDREAAAAELAETQAKIDQIDSIRIDADLSLSKTKAKLEEVKQNFAAIREYKAKALALAKGTDIIIQGIGDINELRKFSVESLYAISVLDKKKDFAAAFAKVDELEQKAISVQSGIELIIRKHLMEIIAWTRCALWNHQADCNVAEGKYSLPEEDFKKYAEAVENLTLGFHTQESLDAHKDKLFGFRCYDRGLTTLNSPRSLEDLKALLALLDEAAKTEKHLLPTLERIAFLHGVACEEFNRLADQYFDLDRNYDMALELFRLRGYFEAEEIVHDDYRLATDETDFRLRFLDKEALRMSDAEFSVAVYAYADSIQKEDELEFQTLCRYALLNGLSDDKVVFLIAAVNRLSFQLEVLFLGTTLELGLVPERQKGILANLCTRKDKTLDLEKCAKALLNCKTLLDSSLAGEFKGLLENLLRSPHARKAVTKSTRGEAHALIGEDVENFNHPWGRPIKDPVIKSWDFFDKTMFVIFAIILPALLLVAGFVVIHLLLQNFQYLGFVLLAPLTVELLHIHLLIAARFGIDERGSAIYRRILGLIALGFAIFALVFFIVPQTMLALKQYAYMALSFAGIAGLWGLFTYKDKKKHLTALIYAPALLCAIAALIMMIVAMINGAI